MAINPRSEWVVLDVETSGLDPRRDRVLSLAMVVLDPDLNVVDTYSTLLNPGVDPGPVHVHGLTREVLAGAPQFADVAGEINSRLLGRVMVAHNASFDHGFLTQEALRCGLELTHTSVLDTLRMARNLGLGLTSLSLGSLAAAYDIVQTSAHDAVDDTNVLVEIFRVLHARTIERGIALYALGERAPSNWKAKPKKTPCEFTNPGRWAPGNALVQGMRVAFSGDMVPDRDDLEDLTTRAGLDVSGSVSSKTSLLVTDEGTGTKSEKARSVGCPIIPASEYAELLTFVAPGTRTS